MPVRRDMRASVRGAPQKQQERRGKQAHQGTKRRHRHVSGCALTNCWNVRGSAPTIKRHLTHQVELQANHTKVAASVASRHLRLNACQLQRTLASRANGPLRATSKHKQRVEGIRREAIDVGRPRSDEGRDIGASAIPDTEPNDLRRKPPKEAALPKVVVFRDDEKPVGCGMIPDCIIRSRLKTQIADVD
jgi:hypothetical protein